MDSKAFSVGTGCLRSSGAGSLASWTDYVSMSFILVKPGEGLLEALGFPQLGKVVAWLQGNLLLSHFFYFCSLYFQYLWDIKDKHRVLKCHFSHPCWSCSEILIIFKMSVPHLPSHVLSP